MNQLLKIFNMKKLFHIAITLMILFSLVNCKFLGLDKEEETTTTEPFRPTGGGGGSDDTATNSINTSVSDGTMCGRVFPLTLHSPQFRYLTTNPTINSSKVTIYNYDNQSGNHTISMIPTNITYGTSCGGLICDGDIVINIGQGNSPVYWSDSGKINYIFEDDNSINGWSRTISGSDITIKSRYFNSGEVWTSSIKMRDINNNIVNTFLDNITIGASAPVAPSEVWIESRNSEIKLNWCEVAGSSEYIIRYGATGNFDNQTNASGDNTSKIISGLSNNMEYNFVIQAKKNGMTSHQTVPVKATPANNPTYDLSINDVILNQTVEFEPDNASETPVNIVGIIGKSTRLRAFISVFGNVDGIKSKVKLEGKVNGNTLNSVSEYFSLRNSTKLTSENFNYPVDFYLPSTYLVNGVTYRLIVDPDNETTETNELNNYFPTDGSFQNLGLQAGENLKIKFVPVFVSGGNNDNLIVSDSSLTNVINYLKAMYPNETVTYEIGSQLTTSNNKNNYSSALGEIETFRQLDKAADGSQNKIIYYGLWTGGESSFSSGTAGVAYRNSNGANSALLSGIGVVFPKYILSTTAHEIGHIHGLPHIICDDETNDSLVAGAAGPDHLYPYNRSPVGNGVSDNTTGSGDDFGRLGKVGYDFRNQLYLSKSLHHDIMSYCNRVWISDYHYKKLYEFQKDLTAQFGSSYQVSGQSISGLTISSTGSENNLHSINNNNLIKGIYISGILTESDRWLIKNIVFIERPKFQVEKGDFEARITTRSGKLISQKFNLVIIEHSRDKSFSFSIPTQEELSNIEIVNVDDNTVQLTKIITESRSNFQRSTRKLERLSINQWKIKATDSGRRIVRRIRPSIEILLFDLDVEDAIITGNEGDIIELQYRPDSKNPYKFEIELD